MENSKNETKGYYGFISYQHKDAKWAKWLWHKLEHYRLPTDIHNEFEDSKFLRPVFLDEAEMNVDYLRPQINKALLNSKYLIVICSPLSSKSIEVNKEVEVFIGAGKEDYIIPFIIDGKPDTKDPDLQCFPKALRDVPDEKIKRGANIKGGKYHALVEVISKILEIDFDTLWQRHKRERKKRIIKNAIITLSFFLLLVGAVFKVFKNYEKEVIICCEQLYHNKDEGLFNVLNKLLGYQENAWFLSKETKTLLKRSIYECDYFYNMCPFPIIYTYQSDFNKIEKIRFLQDDNSVVIKGFKIGVVSLRNGKFKFIDHGTYNFDLIHENQTIVANDSKGVHFYNNQAHQISSFDIHGYQLVSHPQTNIFACSKSSNLSIYDSSGSILSSKKFNEDIYCFAFSRSGNFLAVSTIDSVLSLLNIKTGEVVFQRKDSLPIVSIQCSEEESYFYAACWGDSTIIKKINMGSIHGDTILFKAPSGQTFERIKLSYTKSDYLAFSSGYEFILYNLRNGKICHSFPADIETLCMSPSGKKIAFSINGKIYIKEIKEKEAHFFPMKFYGYENVVGPSVAALYPNDSVVALSTILGKDKSGASELGLFNIYNGKSVGEKFVSHEPIWKIIPLPNSNKAAISEINHDCWEVVNFTNASIENIISPDTLNASSTLMLTANGKYLLGIFKKRLKGALLSLDGCRCLWSATNLQPVDSIYYLSGPLQDGEHLVKADAIYSYPKNEKIRQYADLIPSSKGEIFDGNKMAFWEGYYLSIIDINSDELLNYNLKPHLRGDFENYRLVGFKHGFALIFNGSHLMIVEIKDGDVILNQYVTSASFFNSKQSVLISTSMGLYKYDLLDYKEILYRWKQHLTWR